MGLFACFCAIGLVLVAGAAWLLGLRGLGWRGHGGLLLGSFVCGSMPGFSPLGMPGFVPSVGDEWTGAWGTGLTGPTLVTACAAAATSALPIPPVSWLTVLLCVGVFCAELARGFTFQGVRACILLLFGLHAWVGFASGFSVSFPWMSHPMILFFIRWGEAAAMLAVVAWLLGRRRLARGGDWLGNQAGGDEGGVRDLISDPMLQPLTLFVVSGVAALAHALTWPVGWGVELEPGGEVFCAAAFSLVLWFGFMPNLYVNRPVPVLETVDMAVRLAWRYLPRIFQFWMVSLGIWLAFFGALHCWHAQGVRFDSWRYWSGVVSFYLSLFLAALWFLPRRVVREREIFYD